MATEVIAAIVAIVIAAKATVMAAAKAVTVHRATGARTMPHLHMQRQLVIQTLRLLTTMRSMLNGLLTMLRTLPKILTQPMVALLLSWPSTHKLEQVQALLVLLVPLQVTVNNMVKLMVRHSLLPQARVPFHHRPQITRAMGRPLRLLHHRILPAMGPRRLLRLLLVRLQVVTVRYVHLDSRLHLSYH